MNVVKYLFLVLLGIAAFTGCKGESKSYYDPYANYVDPWKNWSFSYYVPDDTLFNDQWHLKDTPASANVMTAWREGYFGQYVTIAVVDDGMDIHHEDLKDNNTRMLNFNYDPETKDSSNTSHTENWFSEFGHGTAVAGIIAARGWNNTGIIGVAPWAQIVSYNMIEYPNSYAVRNSMERHLQIVDISNNSWGASDTGEFYSANSSWKEGINNGITYGRDGKGILYVFSAGNGEYNLNPTNTRYDNSNYDETVNYYAVMTVAAIDKNGVQASYSERGANIWISAPSDPDISLNGNGIVTTNFGYLYSYTGDTSIKKYTNNFGGTSAAAPFASGAAALLLSADLELSWRDLKLIFAESAKKCDDLDDDWHPNSAKFSNGKIIEVNHKYGFGSIDIQAALESLKNWKKVPPLQTYITNRSLKTIAEFDQTGLTETLNVNQNLINRIEHIAINVTLEHPEGQKLKIVLISPNGTRSVLCEPHTLLDKNYGKPQPAVNSSFFQSKDSFTFGTVRSLYENPNGEWKIELSTASGTVPGKLFDYNITFYGHKDTRL